MQARLGAHGFTRTAAPHRLWPRAAVACLLAVAAVCSGSGALAAPAARPAKAAARSASPHGSSKAPPPAAPEPRRASAVTSPRVASPAVASPAATPAGATPAATTPSATHPPSTAKGATVVKTEEARAGERTYTFGAQEVEGRLKSPQILYFLRRVRAEFDPAPLGHRSFFLELYDTRRHPALE
jgi:hypothetical protein